MMAMKSRRWSRIALRISGLPFVGAAGALD